MVKMSVNLDERDARTINHLKAGRNISRSDILRTAIHDYCVKRSANLNGVHEAIDAAYGVFRKNPVDAISLRKNSNESGRL